MRARGTCIMQVIVMDLQCAFQVELCCIAVAGMVPNPEFMQTVKESLPEVASPVVLVSRSSAAVVLLLIGLAPH
jgi:hypothetical protein